MDITKETAVLMLLLTLVEGQKEMFGQEDMDCLRSNGSVYYAVTRRCHALLERGPCPVNQWLVLQPSTDPFLVLEATCVPCPCCKEPIKRIYWQQDGRCHQSNDMSVCRPGNQLTLDFDGNGVCRCKDGFARVRGNTEDCMRLYQDFSRCKQGQYLVPSGDGWAQCAKNPCPRSGMAQWIDGQCYEINTQGPCRSIDELFRVDSMGELQCVSLGFSSLDSVPTRCREPCIINFNNTSTSGSRPKLSPKLEAFLKKQSLQMPSNRRSAFGPHTDMWAWE